MSFSSSDPSCVPGTHFDPYSLPPDAILQHLDNRVSQGLFLCCPPLHHHSGRHIVTLSFSHSSELLVVSLWFNLCALVTNAVIILCVITRQLYIYFKEVYLYIFSFIDLLFFLIIRVF